MQKSFIERIFPHSNPMLPQDERSYNRWSISLPTTPTSSSSRRSSIPLKPQHASPLASQALQSPPLSSSIAHHADPLLPIDRAAKSLERNIQSFLDAQSEGLVAGFGSTQPDEISSTGSLTPTPSASTPSRTSIGPKVIPIRQPTQKKISLRGARKGLARSMRGFASLRDEEIKVLDAQYQDRDSALKAAQAFEDKRGALESEARTVQEDENSSAAKRIRIEAQTLDAEIKHLEDQLMEMKARHRHMLDQANQLESSVDAKLSSYKSSISMVDMEIRKFLRRPPITHGLPDPGNEGRESGMYALKPERRTLEMAKEQWKTEQEMLAQRKEDVEAEKQALSEGEKVWRSAVQRIAEFEKTLREQTESFSVSQVQIDATALLHPLISLINSLEADLSLAESNEWNLLICALGAELEALREGRSILEQTLGVNPNDLANGPPKDSAAAAAASAIDDDDDQDGPDDDLIRYGGDANGGVLHSPGASSNKSLEATLREFGDGLSKASESEKWSASLSRSASKTKSPMGEEDLKPGGRHQRQPSRAGGSGSGSGLQFGFGPKLTSKPGADSRSDTEDDDPGPDFFVSDL